MKEIEAVLIRSWKFALSKGNTELAEAIASLPMFETGEKSKPVPEAPPFEASPNKKDGFRVPSGKYKGWSLGRLSDIELQRVWAGFNGCGNTKVANILKAEIDRRR